MKNPERRQNSRRPYSVPLHITIRHPDGSESTRQCLCRDVSGGGLSFLFEPPVSLEIGQRIQISVFATGPATPTDLGKATVVWVQDEPDEPAWIGVMLDKLLEDERLQQLLNPTD